MTRRELMQVIGAIGVSNIAGTVSIVEASSAPVLAVLETDDLITVQQAEVMQQAWMKGVQNLPGFNGVKLLVLGSRARLTFYDADGNECTKELIRTFAHGYTEGS